MNARRAILPTTVFLVALAAHFVWTNLFPERDAAQIGWATVAAAEPCWLRRYVETQGIWLGYSYALSLAFAAHALRRYREERFCGARNLALGGLTLSGTLALLGCFLIGCCGSPMLAVYLSILGAGLLAFTGPLVAVLTTASLLAAWWWMDRHRPASASVCPPCGSPECG